MDECIAQMAHLRFANKQITTPRTDPPLNRLDNQLVPHVKLHDRSKQER